MFLLMCIPFIIASNRYCNKQPSGKKRNLSKKKKKNAKEKLGNPYTHAMRFKVNDCVWVYTKQTF